METNNKLFDGLLGEQEPANQPESQPKESSDSFFNASQESSNELFDGLLESGSKVEQFVSRAGDDPKLRASLELAMKKNPDVMAEVQKLSKGTRIPSGVDATDVLADSIDALRIKNRLSQDDIKSMKQDRPALYRYLTNPKNAQISHDEISVLGEIEKVFQGLGAGATQGIGGALSGFDRMNQAGANLLARGLDTVLPESADKYLYNQDDTPELLKSMPSPTRWMGEGGEAFKDLSRDIAPDDPSFASDVASGVGQMTTQIASYLLNPAVGVGVMTSQGADQQSDRQRATGTLHQDTSADLAILLGGAVTGATERLPIEDILNRVPPEIQNKVMKYLTDVSISGGAEAVQEAAENIAQGVLEQVTTNPDVDILDGIEYEAGVAGATGATMRAIFGVLDGRNRQINSTAETAESHISQKLNESVTEQGALDQVVALSQELKTSQRNPEAVSDLVEKFREEHDVEGNVYIDAERLQELYQGVEVDQDNPAIQRILEQMPNALASKSDVVIPMDDFMTYIAPSEFINDLRPHLTLSAGGISQAEAEGVQPIRDEMIKGLQEQAKQTVEIQEESDKIWRQVSQQLMETGRMGRREAELSASIYPAYVTVKAQQTGLSPTEVFERMGVRIEQGDIDAPELSRGKQKVVDAINAKTNSEFTSVTEAVSSDDINIRRGAYEAVLNEAGLEFTDNGETLQLSNGQEIDLNGDGQQLINVLNESGLLNQQAQVTNEVENQPQTSPKTILGDQIVLNNGIVDVEATEEQLQPLADGYTRLYRASSPTVGFDDVFDAEKLPQFKPPKGIDGQFYTDDLAYADYFRETYGKDASIEYIDVPNDQASQFKNGEGSEYFVPSSKNGSQQSQTDTEAFKDWFGDSQVVDENGEPLVVYHGSPADFTVFDPEKTGDGHDQEGAGFYFTSNKDEASGYMDGRKRETSKEKRLGGVYEVYLKIENPVPLEGEIDPDEVDAMIAKANGADSKEAVMELFEQDEDLFWESPLSNWDENPWSAWESQKQAMIDYTKDPHDTFQQIWYDVFGGDNAKYMKAMVELGYDGVILKNEGKHGGYDHYIVFDNTNIKSATDNRGTFDPNDPNILNQSSDALDFDLESAIDALFDDGQGATQNDAVIGVEQTLTGVPLEDDWQSKTKASKDGRPVKIYRGGSTELSSNHFNSTSLGQKTGNPNATLGVWFTTNESDASGYGEVSEFYLDIRNPKVFKTDEVPQFDSQEEATAFREDLEAQGHDGIAMDYSDVGGGTHYVSFKPEQVVPLNDTLFQDSTEKNLFVAHNLSESNFYHAEKIGGLPAPSIAIGNIDKGTFDSFGEITLLANPELLNDSEVRTFDADVYSPRQPRAHYKLNIKKLNEINDDVQQSIKEYGFDHSHVLDPSTIERDGASGVERSSGLKLKYLLDNNVKVPKKKVPHKSDLHKQAKKIIDKDGLGYIEVTLNNKEFMSVAKKHYQEAMRSLEEQGAQEFGSDFFDENGEVTPNYVWRFHLDATRGGEIDRFEVEQHVIQKLRKGKLKEGFERYAGKTFEQIKDSELMPKGTDYYGNLKYAPYTLDNLVKEMTKKLQSGEDYFYGAGSIRSSYAREFGSIQEIQAERDSIIPEKDFEPIKDEANEKLFEALEELKPYYKYDSESFGYSDDAGLSIAEGRKGILEAFENDPKVFEITNELISYLTSLPTTYFEAKAQRAVDFSEFHTAIVPRTASKETKEALKAKGLKVRVYSKNKEGDKERAMRGASKTLFFQSKPDSFVPSKDGQFKQGKKPGKNKTRGSIQLLDNARIIRLGEASDLSTFLHESAHLFLEMEKEFSREFGVTEDQQAILDYLGVKSFDDLDPNTKDGVEAHEKFARSFEAYLYEGKAPSKALQKAFRSFKRWLTQIYNNIRRLNVRLTPEVREVFDRMLATETEIEAVHAEMQYSDLKADIAPDRKPGDPAPKEDAKERLFKKLLGELTRQTKQWWKDDMAALQERNMADMEVQQVYRAEAYIRGDKKLESDPELDLRIDEQEAGEILGYKEPKIKRSKKPDAKYDSLLTFIAKSGGLSQQEAEAQGFDTDFWTGKNARTINQPYFGKRIFAKDGGMTFDEARELANENGYLQGEDTLNAFIDLVDAEVRGEPQYSMSADYDYLYGSEFDAESDIKHKPRRLYGLTKKGGMPAEEVASLTGYDSAYDMLIDLANSEPAEAVAKREAEIEMLRKHGDILNDGSLQDEAREAVHNENQARQLLADLKSLNKRNNQKHVIDRQALQSEAKKIIAQLTVEKLTASVERFHKAEVKSAMAVKEAQVNGDAQAEIRARTQQLFNFYLYREARATREKIEKQRKWLIDARNKKYNSKQIAPSYISHLKRYLSVYDFRKSTNMTSRKRELVAVARWLNAQQETLGEFAPQTLDPLLERIIEADNNNDLDSVSLKGYRKMQIDELQAVYDMAKHLQFVGRRMSEDSKMKERAYHAKIAQSVLDNAPKRKERKEGSFNKKVADFGSGYGSQLLWHADRQITRLDGNEQGELYNAVKRPIDDATTENMLPMMSQASEEMSALYDSKYSKSELRELNKEISFDGYPPQSKWTIISMALNWGNEGNREALVNSMKGNERLYSREQIETYLNALDKKDWEFVQSVWNYVAKYRPMMGKVHQRIHGVTPKWVDADPVYTKHGVFKGGYYPIKFDPGSSFKVTEEELNDLMKQSDFGRFTKAHTKDGFTKERVGSGGRPILLDMSVLHSHVHNVIRYITLAEPVMEAQKVLASDEFKMAMEATNNMDAMSALDVWLKDTASGEMVSSDTLSKLLRRLRTGYTVSKLGWNVGTMLLQPLGIISAMPIVGYGNILKSAVTVFTKPLGKTGMFAMAMEKSNFLKERSSTFNKDIWDIVKAMDENPGTGARIPDVVKKSMFGGIAFMQRFADTTVWVAEYNKGVKAGLSEKDAVYKADRMVAKTQASGVFGDRTPIERGSASASQRQSEFVRIWTALGSYFFAKANMLAEITGRTDFKNPKQVAKYFVDFSMMFVVETLIVSALRGSWPEDEEDIPMHILTETGLSLMSVYPGAREVASSIQGFSGGSAYASVSSEASRLTKAISDIPEDGLDKEFWKSLNNVGGVIFKYPSSATNRFGDALYRDIEGEDVSPEEYFIYRKKD